MQGGKGKGGIHCEKTMRKAERKVNDPGLEFAGSDGEMHMFAKSLALGSITLAFAAQPVSAVAEEAESAVVQRHVDAYRARDIDAFVRTFAPDAIVVANGLVAEGRSEIREFYKLNFAPEAPKIRVVSSGRIGETIYIEAAYVFPTGQEMCCSYSEYTVKDGMISFLTVSG